MVQKFRCRNSKSNIWAICWKHHFHMLVPSAFHPLTVWMPLNILSLCNNAWKHDRLCSSFCHPRHDRWVFPWSTSCRVPFEVPCFGSVQGTPFLTGTSTEPWNVISCTEYRNSYMFPVLLISPHSWIMDRKVQNRWLVCQHEVLELARCDSKHKGHGVATVWTCRKHHDTQRILLTQGKFDFTVFEHCMLQGLQFDKIPSICGIRVFCVCFVSRPCCDFFFPHITSLFYIPFQAEYAFHVNNYIIQMCDDDMFWCSMHINDISYWIWTGQSLKTGHRSTIPSCWRSNQLPRGF